jgi:hypothetical protein
MYGADFSFSVFLVRMIRLMMRHFPPRILAVLIFFLLFLQIAATYWHLFFYVWWLDIPMHVLGGLWVALFVLSSYYMSSRVGEKITSPVFVFAVAVAATFVIGLFWEIYEFAIEHAVGDTGNGLADTLKDLTNDLVGALFAASFFVRFRYNKSL